jgi:alpha-aminoadipic semialdehyde synthase
MYIITTQNDIVIASNIIADAQKIASKYANCKGCEVDVMSSASLAPLVDNADIVISYIPATLHIHVARQCLLSKKNLVTASYVSK